MPYDHQSIEKKWQERWEHSGIFFAKENDPREKFYCLIEFPYPSGAGLHIGHPRSYTALDVIAHKKRMEGKNVLYPIGWDAFGLPTENYAIKTGRKPQDITRENTDTFRRQLKALGLSFDWSREINTTDPAYYKWTQWMFLEFFRAGLAYKAKTEINWCSKDKIGLANEEAAGGVCDRCGGPVEKREKEQWMMAITKYADRLLADLDTVNYLPKIKKQQQDWIGRSVGAEITFPLHVSGQPDGKHTVTVFTTRPDTIFGATFLVISPELARSWIEAGWQAPQDVRMYVASSLVCSEVDRTAEDKEKTGIDTNVRAINPASGKEISVWVADYVIGNYGTGAIMAVPGHDERDFAFAKKFHLPIINVVKPEPLSIFMPNDVAGAIAAPSDIGIEAECWSGDGISIHSEFLDGLKTQDAIEKMILWLEEQKLGKRAVRYKLRDWVFSRQRYWGEPIPLVHCENGCALEQGGWVPVPDAQLPLLLPEVERYQPTDTGESPLAAITDWVNTTCPSCGGTAKRETDTMPNWAGSSWYFLRYTDPHNDHAFASPEALKHWMPVDLYNGGMEHTTLHLLYSRFWNKFLFDRGHVPSSEPYARRHSHGLILAADGSKMSKSKGNVVNPDDLVREYGADSLRLYEMFMGPFEEAIPWNPQGIVGVRRFLEKTTALSDAVQGSAEGSSELMRLAHKCIKRVSDDIEAFKFNTAVAEMMKFVNALQDSPMVPKEIYEILLKLLAPFAPHIAEELWEKLGHDQSIFLEAWPVHDPDLARDEVVEVAVQVNGKLRGTMTVAPDLGEAYAREQALLIENVGKYVEGKEIKKVVYVPGRLLNIVV